METGGFSAKLPLEKMILINNEEITLGQQRVVFNSIDGPTAPQFKASLCELATSITHGAKSGQLKKFMIPRITIDHTNKNNAKDALSVAHIIAAVNNIVDENIAIVCDVGDCLYAGLSIKTDCFIAPGYYSTMGFGVPASIGVQLADNKKRPLVLVGDGGFQMTGTEISTAVKEGTESNYCCFQ